MKIYFTFNLTNSIVIDCIELQKKQNQSIELALQKKAGKQIMHEEVIAGVKSRAVRMSVLPMSQNRAARKWQV
jgi:hypothetical protein